LNWLFYLNIFNWTKSSFNNTRTVSQQRKTLLITTTMMTWRTEKTKPGGSKCWSSQEKSLNLDWSCLDHDRSCLDLTWSSRKKSWSKSSQKSLDHDRLKESLYHNWSCLNSLSSPTINYFSTVETKLKTLLSIFSLDRDRFETNRDRVETNRDPPGLKRCF